MKRFIATLALLAGLAHAAPITMLDVPDETPLYDSSDPFAIGVSTAAYTSATNANARLDALTLALGISAATATNISTYVTAQHANRTDNPHAVTAAQTGALTAEVDTLYTVVSRGQVASNTVAAIITDTALNPFPGLYGTSIYGAGVDGYSAASRGVVGKTLSGYGMQAEAIGVGTGLWAYAATSGVGVYSPHAIISEANITASSFIGSGSALTGPLGTTLTDYASVTNIVLANQQFSATLWGWGSVTSTVAGAYRLTNGVPSGAKQTITNAGATNNQYVAKFITATGQRFSSIAQGEVIVGFSANKGAAGSCRVRPEFYLLDANGATVTEYETGTASAELTTSETPYSIAIPIPSNITVNASNRIGVYLKAVVTSGTPTIFVYSEDSANLSVQVPVPSGDFVTQSQLSGYAPLASPALTGNPTVNGYSISNVWQQIYVTAVAAGNGSTMSQGKRLIDSGSTTNGVAFLTSEVLARQWSALDILSLGTATATYVNHTVYYQGFGAGTDSPVYATWTRPGATAYHAKTIILPPYTNAPLDTGASYVSAVITGVRTGQVSVCDIVRLRARPATAAEISAYQVEQ